MPRKKSPHRNVERPGSKGRSKVSESCPEAAFTSPSLSLKSGLARKDFLHQLWMLADSLDRSVERILKG